MIAFKSAARIVHDESSRIYTKHKHGYASTNSYYNPPPKQIHTEFEIAAVPGPTYLEETRHNIEVVRAGLSKSYAKRIRPLMNKIICLGQKVAEKRAPKRARPRLSGFDSKRKRKNGRLVWCVEHWET